jgi:hypothetical protein
MIGSTIKMVRIDEDRLDGAIEEGEHLKRGLEDRGNASAIR